ncbi:MAG: nucleotidyl transferase AbiEii/AbiGii toxin family protein [Fibrobacteraceae bacterium]|nr:nucleotidyl transferase AbiEii/AbiGii toxin family protein [Fibrobacteraceae bacterium]
MTSVVESMLSKYDCKNTADYRNALKQIVQEVALCGLSRAGFFEYAAFYGGTALRIFYGLDRFSEDMDFSLLRSDTAFELSKYFDGIQKELVSVGFEMTVEAKQKSSDSRIQSAFMKGNTLQHLLKIKSLRKPIAGVPNNEVLKIKFKIDTDPPEYATFENKYKLLPSPHLVQLYDKPSLFAGKLHAVLCRGWKNRIKGRDFYDYLWYVSMNTSVNYRHLQKRLEQTGDWNGADKLNAEKLKNLLMERFATIDFAEAKKDVLPFIQNPGSLKLWSTEFFCTITDEWIK